MEASGAACGTSGECVTLAHEITRHLETYLHMPSKNHAKTGFAAHIMLMVVVLQCVFVAFEAAGVTHGADSSTYHHETLLADDRSGSSTTDNSADPGVIQDADDCDHCCQCHGHGTHFPTLASNNTLVGDHPSSACPWSGEHKLYATYIQSIHRPPIA